jgi:hypothetical protein
MVLVESDNRCVFMMYGGFSDEYFYFGDTWILEVVVASEISKR